MWVWVLCVCGVLGILCKCGRALNGACGVCGWWWCVCVAPVEEWVGVWRLHVGSSSGFRLSLMGTVREEGCEELPSSTKSSPECDRTLLALSSPFIYSSYLMLISGPFASDLRLKKAFFLICVSVSPAIYGVGSS